MLESPVKYFVEYGEPNEDGLAKIEGIYNDRKHDVIPEPNLQVKTGLVQQIVRRPKIYRVDVEKQEIAVVGDRMGGLDKTEALEQHAATYQKTVASGVMVKDVCYYADDEASAHITQCLAILAFDDKFCAELRAVVDGEPKYIEVKPAVLKKVAKEVNQLRVKAKKILHEQNHITHNLT